MQFSIYLNQAKALEWGLNLSQSVLFSYAYELQSWAKAKVIGEEVFYWLSKSKATEEMPLLTEKTDTIKRHLSVLERLGLIERRVINKTKLFIRITEKGKEWNRDYKPEGREKNPPKVGKNFPQGGEKFPPYQYTNNQIDNNTTVHKTDSPVSDQPKTEQKSTKRNVKSKAFKEFFAAYPDHRKGGTDQSAWAAWKSENLTDEHALEAIAWLDQASTLDPETWGKESGGQFAHGITKFIRTKIWKTPLPKPKSSFRRSGLDWDDKTWADEMDKVL